MIQNYLQIISSWLTFKFPVLNPPKRWYLHFICQSNYLLTFNKICKSKLQAIFFHLSNTLFYYIIQLGYISCISWLYIWLEVYWYSDQVYWPSSFLETRPRYKKSASFFMLLNDCLLTAAVSRWHVLLAWFS